MTAPERITLSRAKGWRMPPETRVVTRATAFGNPWAVGADHGFWWPQIAPSCGWESVHFLQCGPLTSGQAVYFFRAWIEGRPIPAEARPDHLTRDGIWAFRDSLASRRGLILSRLPELRGKNLACWCRPGSPCHADVLLRIANAPALADRSTREMTAELPEAQREVLKEKGMIR